MTAETAGFNLQPTDADIERRRFENEQTRTAMKNASDELVDMTVQTPWERNRRAVAEDDSQEDAKQSQQSTLYEGLGLNDVARTRRPRRRALAGGLSDGVIPPHRRIPRRHGDS